MKMFLTVGFGSKLLLPGNKSVDLRRIVFMIDKIRKILSNVTGVSLNISPSRCDPASSGQQIIDAMNNTK
jgi:phosphate starvation-inducible protein PhoH